MISMVKGLMAEGNIYLATERLKLLSNRFPEDFEVVVLARYLSLC